MINFKAETQKERWVFKTSGILITNKIKTHYDFGDGSGECLEARVFTPHIIPDLPMKD